MIRFQRFAWLYSSIASLATLVSVAGCGRTGDGVQNATVQQARTNVACVLKNDLYAYDVIEIGSGFSIVIYQNRNGGKLVGNVVLVRSLAEGTFTSPVKPEGYSALALKVSINRQAKRRFFQLSHNIPNGAGLKTLDSSAVCYY